MTKIRTEPRRSLEALLAELIDIGGDEMTSYTLEIELIVKAMAGMQPAARQVAFAHFEKGVREIAAMTAWAGDDRLARIVGDLPTAVRREIKLPPPRAHRPRKRR